MGEACFESNALTAAIPCCPTHKQRHRYSDRISIVEAPLFPGLPAGRDAGSRAGWHHERKQLSIRHDPLG
jgi:hypothetical protein